MPTSARRSKPRRRKSRQWPPPAAVKDVLDRASRRYGSRWYGRPSLDDPSGVVGLLSAGELLTLAQYDYWPLPSAARRWLRGEADRLRDLVRAELDALHRQPSPDELLSALLELAESRPAELKELLWIVLRRKAVQ